MKNRTSYDNVFLFLGRDWRYQNQDGGDGNLGAVFDVNPGGIVKVRILYSRTSNTDASFTTVVSNLFLSPVENPLSCRFGII